MMPQPVDLPTELARVNAAERIQQVADRVSLASHNRAVLEDQEDRLQIETAVQHTHETESRQVDAEGRRSNPFVGRKRRRESEQEEDAHENAPEAPAHADLEPHQFDVTV